MLSATDFSKTDFSVLVHKKKLVKLIYNSTATHTQRLRFIQGRFSMSLASCLGMVVVGGPSAEFFFDRGAVITNNFPQRANFFGTSAV
jgi:hypothetical protein